MVEPADGSEPSGGKSEPADLASAAGDNSSALFSAGRISVGRVSALSKETRLMLLL